MMIKVATGFYIRAEKITFIGLNETVSVKNRLKALKEKKHFLDLTKNQKIKAIIFYEQADGEYGIASPLTCETIIGKINNPISSINPNTKKRKDD